MERGGRSRRPARAATLEAAAGGLQVQGPPRQFSLTKAGEGGGEGWGRQTQKALSVVTGLDPPPGHTGQQVQKPQPVTSAAQEGWPPLPSNQPPRHKPAPLWLLLRRSAQLGLFAHAARGGGLGWLLTGVHRPRCPAPVQPAPGGWDSCALSSLPDCLSPAPPSPPRSPEPSGAD